jgi:hypothetical protein
VVKNAPKWRLGYDAYKINVKNGGVGVTWAIDGEEEALGTNALPSRLRGHKASKDDLKRDA